MHKAADDDARRVALRLLAQGVARPHEVAELAGVSLQVVNYWINHANLDWHRMRTAALGKAWRKGMQRGPKLVERQAAIADENRSRE